MLDKFLLYFHTLKHLRWIQIKYRIYYILRSKWRNLTGFKYDFSQNHPKPQNLQFLESINSYQTFILPSTFNFLNLEKEFSKTKIDWNYNQHGKLWTYNLNYFEFLHQKKFDKEIGIFLIDDFIKKINSSKDGLEPFPISLRVLFWTRFFINQKINIPLFNQSLYAQLKILSKHCEYHLMGNHLLENGFGLLFGAYYFKDKEFYNKAKSILISELEEQILADGAHFELSPMYHQLMLYRVLDCLNLIKSNQSLFDGELFSFFQNKAQLMLNWLNKISWQNKEIPHFNDSTNGIAPNTKELIEYAKRLNIFPTDIQLSDSGYRKYQNSNLELIVDVGKIGPDYIPGHAHSDSLGFSLRIHKLDFIIDTAISTYEKNSTRQLERSTSAHNTVQIEELEQSNIWGGFRVAKRAYTKIINEDKEKIIASHDGYKKLDIVHQREFIISAKKLIINDQISKSSTAVARFHFDPKVEINIKNNQIITKDAVITFNNHSTIEEESFFYGQEFNKRIKSKVITAHFKKELQTEVEIL